MNKTTSFQSIFLRIPILGAIPPLIALLVPALLFLPQESLWTDETTVLSGLTLGPIEIIGWLSGQFHNFNVPPDNAPPVGYWLQMLWSSIFGLTEISLRYFALFVVGIAVVVVYETARKAFGFTSGLLAGFLFALSPNVIEQAVNIRVYPILLLISACGFYCLVRFFEQSESNQNKWLIGIVAFSILATYSHFFGVLMAGSLLSATLLGSWREGRSLKPVLLAIIIAGFAAIGLVPFLIAMFSHLGNKVGGSDEGNILAIMRLLYRQFAHPTTAVSIVAVISAALGFSALVILSIIKKDVGYKQRDAILTALIAGFVVIVIGRFLVSPLVTETRYNLWILPGLCVLLSSSLAVTFRFSNIIKTVAILLLLGANVYSASRFIINGTYFSHSRFSSVNAYIQKLEPENITIIHDGNAAVCFAIQYSYGSKIDQFMVMPDEKSRYILKRFPDLKTPAGISAINTRYIMLLRTKAIGSPEIANRIKNGKMHLEDSVLKAIMDRSGNWRLKETQVFVSYFQTDMRIYEKK
ncbi:MAG: glycosyltransferase family 39 protein [Spirochaetota bacterium]